MEITEVPHLVVPRRFNTTFAKSLVQYTDIHAPPLCGLGPHAAMAKRAADRVHATVEHAKVRGGRGGERQGRRCHPLPHCMPRLWAASLSHHTCTRALQQVHGAVAELGDTAFLARPVASQEMTGTALATLTKRVNTVRQSLLRTSS